jgi:hypothetical protein
MVALRAAELRVQVEVREWGTMAPVPQARVAVGGQDVKADHAGRATVVLRARPLSVSISASAPEFMAIDEVQQLPVPYDSPSMAARVYLARKKTITGTLLDPATEKPLKGFEVRLLRETKYRGERMFKPMETVAVTGDDGRFELIGFMPASFALRISRSLIYLRESPDEEKPPEWKGRYVAFWPGIHNEEPNHAISITHGLEQELGKVYAPEVPLYTISAAIEGTVCGARDYDVSVYRRKNLVRERLARLQVRCGSRFYVENLPAGEYVLEALRPDVEIASRVVRVDRNEHFKLLARPGFFVDVGFAVEKTGGQVFAKLAYSDGEGVPLHSPRKLWMWPGEPYEFNVHGLAPGYFFESMLLPDSRVAAGELVRLPGPGATSMKLVVAKPAAFLAGKVTDSRGEPVPALIEAVREGAPHERKSAMAGSDGKFALRWLAPGRYRVFAADAEELAVFVEAKAGEPAWAEVKR